jgi:phosphate starvation-inducible PhoH-like protein
MPRRKAQPLNDVPVKASQPQYAREEFSVTKLKVNFLSKTENQKLLSKLIKTKDIVICGGPAGTGKTYVACAEALRLLVNPDSFYTKIIIAKSVTVTEGEDIGFLKGSMKEKMEPFMESFLDNFFKIIGKPLTMKLMEHEIIEVLPLAYIRGRSIDNTIIIVDEAQNISLKNMRTTMTRLGEDSKMIILGDTKQIDLKNRSLSSLETVMNIFGKNPNFGIVQFNREDIVRNPLIIHIEDEFEKYEEALKTKPSVNNSSSSTKNGHSEQ